jgi:putative ABC transport system permease protein
MGVIWRKVWRDLWLHKFRTVLVVLSTAVGVFALGFVYGGSGVMRRWMTESHQASVPAHLTFYTSRFEEELVDTVLGEPGIVDAQPQLETTFRWKLEGDEEWHDAVIIGRPDFQAQRFDLYKLLEGEWPSYSLSKRTLTAERMSSSHYRVPIGTEILVEFGHHERRIRVEGIARHSNAPPPQLIDIAFFFATPETISWLTGQGQGYNQLKVRLESFSEEGANEVGERIQDRLERMGMGVGGYEVSDPEVHWAQDVIDSLLLIMKVLGGLSLALSGFLIVNMMNATVTQQMWQIGVMKVFGATRTRVLCIYLTMALIYGLLSLPLSVLPGALAAHLLAKVLLGIFNVPSGPFRLVPAAVAIQIGVGLLVPLLAALVPVIGGARITPHDAMRSYGIGAGFGASWFDQLIGRIRRLPRPFALSLRNTFRRKARIVLTLTTLVLGGVMFIVVLSVSASMNKTLEVVLDDFGFDVMVGFNRQYRVVRVEEVAESVPGVAKAEVWDRRGAQLALAENEEREVYLWSLPPDSQMFRPRILDGRGLMEDDDRAILLNSKIAADEGIEVGDEIELTVGDKESSWTVVGLILNVNNLQRDNFVPFDALARETGSVSRGAFVQILGIEHDSATQRRLIRDLRAAYTARGMKPSGLQSADEVRQANKMQFNVITILMLAMSILAAVVGSVGLMSTMSINVVERGREIGMMRAIGARSVPILSIFVVEGMFVGVLSWLCAAPLSYPGARVFNDLVSKQLFQMPLDFSYSVGGVVLWLAIVVLLSAAASFWPALRATQVSVRESLAYE